MIIILTEDTSTGFEFMNLLSDHIFQSPVRVYHTGYPDGTGSYSKIYLAVSRLITDKKINKGDIVFIMYDDIIPLPTKEGMYADKRALDENIDKSRKRLKKMGVKCYTSAHTCIEEAFISFREIVDFGSLPDRDMDTSEIRLCRRVQELMSHGVHRVQYTAVFSEKIRAGKTVENCLKDLLKSVTADRDFTNFKIEDNMTGICWKCGCAQARSVLKGIKGAYCGHCYAVQNINAIKTDQLKYRLEYVYNHCILKDELEPLGIQLVT